MNQKAIKRSGLIGAFSMILILAVFATTGCVNINVDADSYARKYMAVADSASAAHIAKDRVRQEGLEPKDYKTSAKEDNGAYWVTFDLIASSKTKGWPVHFVVRVASDGTAEIYKNR